MNALASDPPRTGKSMALVIEAAADAMFTFGEVARVALTNPDAYTIAERWDRADQRWCDFSGGPLWWHGDLSGRGRVRLRAPSRPS